MLFKELLEGRLRTKILLDVAPKGKAKDKWKESTEARMLRDLFPENVVISDELLQKITETIESRFFRKAFCSGAQKVGKSKSEKKKNKRKEQRQRMRGMMRRKRRKKRKKMVRKGIRYLLRRDLKV